MAREQLKHPLLLGQDYGSGTVEAPSIAGTGLWLGNSLSTLYCWDRTMAREQFKHPLLLGQDYGSGTV